MEPYDATSEIVDHIRKVNNNLSLMVVNLLRRGQWHDASKFYPPEREASNYLLPRLRGVTYGSAEYHEIMAEMAPAILHHVTRNDHHPEYQATRRPDGSYDKWEVQNGTALARMNLMQIAEMLCDWHAASQRGGGGDFADGLEINIKRYGIGEQLASILRKTAKDLGFLQ